jgi:hypothetical protein
VFSLNQILSPSLLTFPPLQLADRDLAREPRHSRAVQHFCAQSADLTYYPSIPVGAFLASASSHTLPWLRYPFRFGTLSLCILCRKTLCSTTALRLSQVLSRLCSMAILGAKSLTTSLLFGPFVSRSQYWPGRRLWFTGFTVVLYMRGVASLNSRSLSISSQYKNVWYNTTLFGIFASLRLLQSARLLMTSFVVLMFIECMVFSFEL